MGSSGSSAPQVQRQEPWAGAQPNVLEALAGAQQLYRQGPTPYYGGQVTADLNPLTAAGWNQQAEYLGGGDAQNWIHQQRNTLTDIMGGGGGGYSPADAAQISGNFGVDRSQVMGGTGGRTLSQFASGGENPWLDSAVSRAQGRVTENLRESILPSIASGAQMAGQYGSSRQGIAEGLAMRDANRQAGDIAAQMYGGAYESDAGRRFSAGQSLFGMDADISRFNAGQGFGAASQNAGFMQQANLANASNRMQAGANQTGYQLQALGMAPGIISQNLGLGQGLANIGQGWQNYQQGLLDNASQRYQYEAGAPRDLLTWYQQMANGTAGLGGQTTATGPGPNRAAGAVGGAMAGAQMGSYFGPWGTAIGAIGGGLLGSRG